MKIFFLISLFLLQASFYCIAQKETLDSLSITYTNLQDENELTPVSTKNAAIQNAKIQIHISFVINDPANLKEINVAFGKQSGNGDLKKVRIKCIKQKKGYFLTYGDRIFPVINRRVVIDDVVPEALLRKETYAVIQALDLNKKVLKTYTRKLK